MKGKSKAGRVEARKNAVKESVVREFVKEVNELQKKEEKSGDDKKEVEEDYNVLSRFKVKKKFKK